MEDLKKSLDSLKDLLNEEIKKVTKKADITPIELENMTKTLCLIEKIKMVEQDGEYMDSFEEGQSGRYYPNRSYGIDGRHHWDDPRMYDGLSGRRMRSPSTGRYMSGNNTRSYGMPDPGYSGHSIKDRMVAKLEEMYDEAKTEHERQIVDEWINRLEDR